MPSKEGLQSMEGGPTPNLTIPRAAFPTSTMPDTGVDTPAGVADLRHGRCEATMIGTELKDGMKKNDKETEKIK